MREHRKAALGFVNFARSYLSAATCVIDEVGAGRVKLSFDAPIFALLAHSLELSLKGALTFAGTSKEEVEAFEHKILELYDSARATAELDGLITHAENNCRDRWKTLLRTARDEHKSRMVSGFGTLADDPEFGVFDNQTIGRELPELRAQVIWLSDRHSIRGSLFRYHETRIDQHLEIHAFGLKENVPLRTIQWGCDDLVTSLEGKLRLGN